MPKLEEKWRAVTIGIKVNITSNNNYSWKRRTLQKGNELIEEWYDIPDARPHVTFLVNEGYDVRKLGYMVKRAEAGIIP